jgi:hypothetical protein
MAFGMISGTVGATPGSAVTIGTNQAGGLAQMNVAMIGGIMTGSNNQFSSLPVAGASDALGMPANAVGSNGTLVLSSSFAGFSGSIIQALNFLKASNDTAGDITFLEVNQALQEATGSVHLGRVGGTDAILGGTNFSIGVAGDTDLMHLDGDVVFVSGAIKAQAALNGASVKITDDGTIGPVSQADLITLTSDGDLTFKDGAFDLNIASHDGTNGLALAGTIVTATAANLNLNTGVTAGTAIASRVVSLDGSKDVAGLRNVTSTLTNGEAVGVITMGAFSGTQAQFGSADNPNSRLILSRTAMSGAVVAHIAGLQADGGVSAATLANAAGNFGVSAAGALSAVSADIADVQIAGTTIGHTDDTDIITLADQEMTIANNVDFSILKAGGLTLADGNVTSTAAELNLIDGSSAGTVVNSKAVIYGAAGQVAATTVSGASNISANAFIMAGTNAAGAAKLFKLSVDGGIMLVSEAGTP